MMMESLTRWLWITAGLALPAIHATEVCMKCRPLELQRAPGLAIDLSMSHGTAAIKFRNGTINDIIAIPGSVEYISAMKIFAEDSARVRHGAKPSLSAVYYQPIKPVTLASLSSNCTTVNIWKYLKQPIYRQFPSLDPTPHKPDPWIHTMVAMLANLKTGIWEVYPLSKPLIMLSVPDCETETRHIYKEAFRYAAQQAGFELLQPAVKTSSRAALKVHKIEDCYGSRESPDPPCPLEQSERIDVVLSLSYNDCNFGVTLMTRWGLGPETWLWGTMWPLRVEESFNLGRESSLRLHDPDEYWKEVRKLIEDFLQGESIDRVVFLGARGNDVELRELVKLILVEYGDPLVAATDVRSEDTLFAAARGGAISARWGMIHGFDACLVPDRCEKANFDENGHEIESKLTRRSEL